MNTRTRPLTDQEKSELDAYLLMLYGVETGNEKQYHEIRDRIVDWVEELVNDERLRHVPI
jgi:hypothetical protein